MPPHQPCPLGNNINQTGTRAAPKTTPATPPHGSAPGGLFTAKSGFVVLPFGGPFIP